jgi:hypothetical protein
VAVTRPAQLEITPRLRATIADLRREGVTVVDIAAGLGVGERSLRRWLSVGRHSDRPPYRQFVADFADAEHERRQIVANLLAEARSRLD